MKMLKNFFVVLVVFLLICFGIYAPYVAAQIQDTNILGQELFHKVPSVQIQVQEANNVLLTLKVMSEIDSVLDIPEALAVLTQEEALGIARSTLDSYRAAGVIEEYTEDSARVSVFLGQRKENPEHNCVFWNIQIRGTVGNEVFEATISIDDVSGKVIGVHFTGKHWADQIEREDLLTTFTTLFLSELGITERDNIVLSTPKEIHMDGVVCGFAYELVDPSYGKTILEFRSDNRDFIVFTVFPNASKTEETTNSSELTH